MQRTWPDATQPVHGKVIYRGEVKTQEGFYEPSDGPDLAGRSVGYRTTELTGPRAVVAPMRGSPAWQAHHRRGLGQHQVRRQLPQAELTAAVHETVAPPTSYSPCSRSLIRHPRGGCPGT